ncbi:MAG: di-trans,poly-cis-decaprenylcistransferase [Gammaproteobacteria bacterium GWE2_37_16]|nr:MAG: di-trans,poly-cis-decaprenylcistransferase [Gammaproteobacteria bacterium GWE2_37_16]
MKMGVTIPKHVAIIMDGNGRWAKKRNLPRFMGHRAGAGKIREIADACIGKNVEILTLWAFSTENWGRPAEEVAYLMKLFSVYIKRAQKELMEHNVQFRVIGDREKLNPKLQRLIEQTEQKTLNNAGLKLVIALNYSGRWDITQAMQKLAKQVLAKQLKPEDITTETIQAVLCLADLSEPDLFIRPGGEQRISNYLLWQLAYTELYFTEVFWPDFNAIELEKALQFYATRERRFGLTSEQLEKS